MKVPGTASGVVRDLDHPGGGSEVPNGGERGQVAGRNEEGTEDGSEAGDRLDRLRLRVLGEGVLDLLV